MTITATVRVEPKAIDWDLEGVRRCDTCQEPVGVNLHGDNDTATFTEYTLIEDSEHPSEPKLLCDDCLYWIGKIAPAVLQIERAAHPHDWDWAWNATLEHHMACPCGAVR